MGNVSIRAGRPGDAPRVAELTVQWGYPGAGVAEARARLERWAGDVLVAEVDGRVEGLIAVTSYPVFEKDARIGKIVALVVSDASRGKGIGRLLVAAAEDRTRAIGCLGVEVTSSRRRTEAHAFYPAVGYAERCELKGHFYKEF